MMTNDSDRQQLVLQVTYTSGKVVAVRSADNDAAGRAALNTKAFETLLDPRVASARVLVQDDTAAPTRRSYR
jgi:hypothetical protein